MMKLSVRRSWYANVYVPIYASEALDERKQATLVRVIIYVPIYASEA
jgi:hypothetical protein